MSLPMVILAGGLGTRLGGMAQNSPKSMIPILGKPFIEWQIRNLAESGFSDLIICIGHLGDQITEFLGDGKRYGVRIEYSNDGALKLGTGGALLKALMILPETFMVTYGDSFLSLDYGKVEETFHKSDCDALLSVTTYSNGYEAFNCSYENGLVKKYVKKGVSPELSHIDLGCMVFNKRALQSTASKTTFDLGDLVSVLATKEALAGYEVDSDYFEIGSIRGIEVLEQHLRNKA